MPQVVLISALFWLASAAVALACGGDGPCPPGYSCQLVQIDPFTSREQCVPDNPVPEMELLMVPAAMGAAGFLAYRARKKAQKKS